MWMVKKGILLLGFSIITAFILVQHVEAKDKKEPEEFRINVTKVKVNASKLKSGDKLKISMRVRGNGYKNRKIKTVDIFYQSERGQRLELPLKYNAAKNNWSTTFKIPGGMQKGKWMLYKVWANGTYGAGTAFGAYDSYHEGYSDGSNEKELHRLSSGNIKISGTKADYTRPKIDWKSFTVCKRGNKLYYQLKVTDKSPIKSVELGLTVKDGKVYSNERGWFGLKMKYNKKKECYEFTWPAKSGINEIYSVSAEDIFGNCVHYFNVTKKHDETVQFDKFDRFKDYSKYTITVK